MEGTGCAQTASASAFGSVRLRARSLTSLASFADRANLASRVSITTFLIFTSFTRTAGATEVRVRMSQLKPTFSVSAVGLRLPGAVGRQQFETESFGFRAVQVSWRVHTRGFSIWTLSDRDSGEILAQVHARTLELSGMNLRVNLKPAPEQITLMPSSDAKQTIDLIARLDLEDYLRGVLPSEMPANWPLEALKAQAVAARSFALYRKEARDRIGASYHLESTVMDQVFHMPLIDEGADEKKANVEKAIEETRGIVLRDDRERVVAAYFHADCGGRTEDAKAVWGGNESLGTAVDGSCPMNPLARWNAKFSADELADKLRGKAGRGQKVTLLAIESQDRTPSGRIASLQATWSDGTTSKVSAHQLRMSLGHDRVRSTNFKIEREPSGAYSLKGLGFGHGVGMCQWGAKRLAQDGKSFRAILRHYYPKTTIVEPAG